MRAREATKIGIWEGAFILIIILSFFILTAGAVDNLRCRSHGFSYHQRNPTGLVCIEWPSGRAYDYQDLIGGGR